MSRSMLFHNSVENDSKPTDLSLKAGFDDGYGCVHFVVGGWNLSHEAIHGPYPSFHSKRSTTLYLCTCVRSTATL